MSSTIEQTTRIHIT